MALLIVAMTKATHRVCGYGYPGRVEGSHRGHGLSRETMCKGHKGCQKNTVYTSGGDNCNEKQSDVGNVVHE